MAEPGWSHRHVGDDFVTVHPPGTVCPHREAETGDVSNDLINHPDHYTGHPSGVECIQITEHMGFNLGNAVKYIWRADSKGDAEADLKKAEWYIDRELKRRGFR